MFEQTVDQAAGVLRKYSMGRIHVYSHYDADGITSASIMIKILEKFGNNYTVSIIKEMSQGVIDDINEEKPDAVIFLDIGSSPEVLNIDSSVFTFVIDHHEPFAKLSKNKNIFYLNPMLSGIDSLSNSAVMFFLAKKFGVDAPHIALIGLVGDVQDMNSEYASKIIDNAIELGYIKKVRSLRIFGHNTRSLVKALEYSYDPYIPGLSGNESAIFKFLDEIGIKAKDDEKWRSFNDLSEEEKKKICSAIVMQRLAYGQDDAEDIFSDYYMLTVIDMDINEMSTALNAFGRLERYDEGIIFCLKPGREKYDEIMKIYRTTIGTYLNWVEENKNTSAIIEIGKNIIINGGNLINGNFIGTVCSILNKSGYNTVIGLAERDNKIKVSGRSNDINVQKLFSEIALHIGGSTGGHKNAAGMVIPVGSEERFINLVKQSLLQQ